MGRLKGSKNQSANGDEAPRRNSANGGELAAYIARLAYCNSQQREISSERKQVYAELKQAGYSVDAVREIVRRRKMTDEERQERAATLDMYLSALGDFSDTPLGQAGARDLAAHVTDG